MWTSPPFFAGYPVNQGHIFSENNGNQAIQQGFESSSYISIQFDRDRVEKVANILTDAAWKWKDIPSSNSYIYYRSRNNYPHKIIFMSATAQANSVVQAEAEALQFSCPHTHAMEGHTCELYDRQSSAGGGFSKKKS